MGRPLLMIPGPIELHESVLQALSQPQVRELHFRLTAPHTSPTQTCAPTTRTRIHSYLRMYMCDCFVLLLSCRHQTYALWTR